MTSLDQRGRPLIDRRPLPDCARTPRQATTLTITFTTTAILEDPWKIDSRSGTNSVNEAGKGVNEVR